MERVTISELRKNLSAYLNLVRSGEEVIVLDRTRPIARLARVSAGAEIDERLQQLEREGAVRRGARALDLDLVRARPPRSKESVLEALLDERREGR